MDAIGEKNGTTVLRVRVQPRASRNAASIDAQGRVRVALTAPPLEGAANKALIDFVAQWLDIPRRQIQIDSGDRAREKALAIAGISAEDIRARIAEKAQTDQGKDNIS